MVAPVDHIADFEADWTRIRQSDQPPPRRAKKSRPADLDFIRSEMSRRDLIRMRLDSSIGFVWRGGKIGEYPTEPFSEAGLKTQDPKALVLRRFVQLSPRASKTIDRLCTGMSKGQLFPADSKLLALDDAYIELNRKMRGAWRIDLDSDWPCWEALRDDLELLVKAFKLPCLPHAAVAWVDPVTNVVRRPHLWFLLPYKSSVWFSDDERCNKHLMTFFNAVVHGCTSALLPLGADPSAIMLPLKGKNPLSPMWDSCFWNQHHFPTLSEWADYVSTTVSRGDLARDAANRDCGTQSNKEFRSLQQIAYAQLRALHIEGSGPYQAGLLDRAALQRLLLEKCRSTIAHIAGDKKDRRSRFAVFKRVATYAAASWDPSRCRARLDRGACSDQVNGLDQKHRQAVGANYAAEQNSTRCRGVVQSAIAKLMVSGRVPSKSEVARFTGLARATVIKWWVDPEACIKRCIDPLGGTKRRIAKYRNQLGRNRNALTLAAEDPKAAAAAAAPKKGSTPAESAGALQEDPAGRRAQLVMFEDPKAAAAAAAPKAGSAAAASVAALKNDVAGLDAVEPQDDAQAADVVERGPIRLVAGTDRRGSSKEKGRRHPSSGAALLDSVELRRKLQFS